MDAVKSGRYCAVEIGEPKKMRAMPYKGRGLVHLGLANPVMPQVGWLLLYQMDQDAGALKAGSPLVNELWGNPWDTARRGLNSSMSGKPWGDTWELLWGPVTEGVNQHTTRMVSAEMSERMGAEQ